MLKETLISIHDEKDVEKDVNKLWIITRSYKYFIILVKNQASKVVAGPLGAMAGAKMGAEAAATVAVAATVVEAGAAVSVGIGAGIGNV